MNVAALAVAVCVYLCCESVTCEQKTFLWIQHPDVSDYYEYLLNERASCEKAHVGKATRMIKHIATVGKKSPKPPRSPSENSPSPHPSDSEASTTPRPKFLHSDNACCRTTTLKTNEKALERVQSFTVNGKSHSSPLLTAIPPEEGYRYLRSSSTLQNYSTSSRSRYRALPFLDQNLCPVHRKSILKKMSTPDKQELCDADLILFAFLDERIPFGRSEADAQRSERRIAHDVLTNAHHPVLDRERYNIHKQSFVENIPKRTKKRKNKDLSDGRRKKKEKKYERLGDESTSKEKKNYVKIFVKTRADPVLVKAVPCIVYKNHSWSLVDGYARDLYFTVEKNSNQELHHVTGLLDVTATVSLDENNVPLSSSALEHSFRSMQLWIVRSNSRLDLCILDNIQKFRLCSVVYFAWQKQVNGTVSKYNFLRAFKKDDCTGPVLLKSNERKNVPVSDVPVTLVPCMINSDEPAFYMTPSEDSNSVFIVKSSNISSPENEKDYFLHLHITHITMLRNIAQQTLLTSYQRDSRPKSF